MRKFLYIIRRTVRLRKAHYQVSRLTRARTRRVYWLCWLTNYNKYMTHSDLCYQIYAFKYCKKVLRIWHKLAIERLLPAQKQMIISSSLATLRNSLHLWRNFYHQRIIQQGINSAINSSRKRRILHQWHTYITTVKQHQHICRHIILSKINVIFSIWKKKVRNYIEVLSINRIKHIEVLSIILIIIIQFSYLVPPERITYQSIRYSQASVGLATIPLLSNNISALINCIHFLG